MKRCILITLLVFALLLCAWLVQNHMHHQIEDIQAEFEMLESLLQAGNRETAKRECRRIVDIWDDKREF